MTILKAGVDQGLGTRTLRGHGGPLRSSSADAARLAHLLLLPKFEAALHGDRPAVLLDRLQRKAGWQPPASCAAICTERRALAHLLAFHAVGAMSLSDAGGRPFRSQASFRELNRQCLQLLAGFGGGR